MFFPIQISLYHREAEALLLFILDQTTGFLTNPDVGNDLIVCAEYSPLLYKNCQKNRFKNSKKTYVYKMPLSVVRIIHERLQEYQYSMDLQSVLLKIHQILSDMEFVPTPSPRTS